jgi:hypothetical protein
MMRGRGVLCLLFSGAAVAAGQTLSQATEPPRAAASAASHTIVGELVSIDLVAKTVVIRDSVKTSAPKTKRETVTLALGTATTLVRGKKPVELEELRPKDHVVARYLVVPAGAKAISLRVADRTVRVSAAPGSSTVVSATPDNAPDASNGH